MFPFINAEAIPNLHHTLSIVLIFGEHEEGGVDGQF